MSRKGPPGNVAASVAARLASLARGRGEDFGLVLTRYGLERLLYRLSRSRHVDDFILKGAMLFQIWSGEPHRPTRDLDLLGRGESSAERLTAIFQAICRAPVEEDGLVFPGDGIRTEEIRERQEYGGLRMLFAARLGNARIPIQIDIGFGDAVTPRPTRVEFPTLLDLPPPVLWAYTPESVVAEKFQAMVALGIANTRMRDFYDVWILSRHFDFNGHTLSAALRATFARRDTEIPEAIPTALSDAFARDAGKRAQWTAFLRKGNLRADGPSLSDVIHILRAFLMPPVDALREGRPFESSWPAGGPWSEQTG